MGKLFVLFGGLLVGIIAGIYLFFGQQIFSSSSLQTLTAALPHKREVIGFLPYWLLDKADKDYSSYVTTIAYFGLTVGSDGKIVKLNNPQEEEPGWTAFKGQKLSALLTSAKEKNMKRSLVVFNGDEDSIGSLISQPQEHAQNLMQEVIPLMKQNGYTDLNIDIESVKEASPEAQNHFTDFIKEVRKQMDESQVGSLSIDISPTAFIKPFLIDPKSIVDAVDTMIIMAYDYHYQGSFVTGPVAPLEGAGSELEFDTAAGIGRVLAVAPASKVILGIPLYGYEWETIGDGPHAAVIPETGITASNGRVEDFLASCASCSARFDETAQEAFLVYNDQETGTNHEIYFPDEKSTQAKIDFAKKNNLGGLALWALGYEGNTIMKPLSLYK